MRFTPLAIVALTLAPLLSLLLTTLTYALRDLSRTRLAEALGKRGRDDQFEATLEDAPDLSFLAGAGRLLCNGLVLLGFIDLFRESTGLPVGVQYALAVAGSVVVLVVVSLALPRALAWHYGEDLVAASVVPLHAIRKLFSPVLWLMHAADHVVGVAANRSNPEPTRADTVGADVHEQLLDKVEEAQAAGVVDPRQRQLIERAMEFTGLTVDEAMTPRKSMIALPIESTLDEVRAKIEATGLSRVPIYCGTVDRIEGVLYSRDLLKLWGNDGERFELRGMLRTPLFVPRTKRLADLLQDFILQKVHIAIVSDEYGGTAGLVTIEDCMEALVGDISDEHEPLGPLLFRRLGDSAADVDASIAVDDLNRLLGLDLPEEGAFETLAGFVTTTLQRIPTAGASFESHGARFTVTEAEPTRVRRVRVDLLPPAAATVEPAGRLP